MTRDTEPVCDRVPNGPYKDKVSSRGLMPRGGSFSQSLRDRIVKENQKHGDPNAMPPPNAPIYSDAWNMGVDNYDTLIRSSEMDVPKEDDPDYSAPLGGLLAPKSTGSYASTVQIDHIIPRIDKYGCGCGPNSPANALVISARLNGEMSNNTEHWARYELLQEHTLDPVAGKPTRPGDAEPVLDGPDDDHELGGCSTGGGAGGLAGLGGLGLAWSRRRRR